MLLGAGQDVENWIEAVVLRVFHSIDKALRLLIF